MAKATALDHNLMDLGSKARQNWQDVPWEGAMPGDRTSERRLFLAQASFRSQAGSQVLVLLPPTWEFSDSVRSEGAAEQPICCCSSDKHSPSKRYMPDTPILWGSCWRA